MAVLIGCRLGKNGADEFVKRIIRAVVARNALSSFKILRDIFELLPLLAEFFWTKIGRFRFLQLSNFASLPAARPSLLCPTQRKLIGTGTIV